MEQRLVCHWRVGAFRTSLWYGSGDRKLHHDGSICDCDAWKHHQRTPPGERICDHIEAVIRHVSTVESDEIDAGNIELLETEVVAVRSASPEKPVYDDV